ncbi:MAG: response regulator [Myxococcales bacterium]|nr:response regulator [Myxococcales bacterium]
MGWDAPPFLDDILRAATDGYRAELVDPGTSRGVERLEALVGSGQVRHIEDRLPAQVAELLRVRAQAVDPPGEAAMDGWLGGREAWRCGRWAFLPWRSALVHVLGPRDHRERIGAVAQGAHVLVSGAGAEPLVLGLVRDAIVQRITLVAPGAATTARQLVELDPYVRVDVVGALSDGVVDAADAVVDVTEDLAGRGVVRRAARAAGVPLIAWSGPDVLEVERFDAEPAEPGPSHPEPDVVQELRPQRCVIHALGVAVVADTLRRLLLGQPVRPGRRSLMDVLHRQPTAEDSARTTPQGAMWRRPRSSARSRVLVVCADAAETGQLMDSLRPLYHVLSVPEGDDALGLASKHRPDVVVVDAEVTTTAGTPLAQALREQPETQEIPVVVLADAGRHDPASLARAHGAQDYVTRPCAPVELLSRVGAQIELLALRRQVADARRISVMSSLTAGLAHEVRNPINAIVNGAPALRAFVSDDAPVGQRLLDVVEDAARRVSGMVRELLDFAHLEQGGATGWCPAGGVASAVALLELRASGSGVEVHAPFAGWVAGRATQLDQVVLNLIDNALRALRGRGTVTITVEQASGGVRVVVADDGPGIDEDHLHRVFDPFFTTRSSGEGTGLGLHLCRQIVSSHQGRLSVTSTPGHGARFVMWLPGPTWHSSTPGEDASMGSMGT